MSSVLWYIKYTEPQDRNICTNIIHLLFSQFIFFFWGCIIIKKTNIGILHMHIVDYTYLLILPVFFYIRESLSEPLFSMLPGPAHISIESFSIAFSSTKIELVFL